MTTTQNYTVPSYGTFAGPSSMSFTDTHDVTYFFSYDTLIAVRYGAQTIVRQNDWSVTTGKHLNAIDGGAKSLRVDANAFHDAVAGLIAAAYR